MSHAAEKDEQAYPKPRRAHQKSRHGCRNCKQRRVKCDEQRPVCGNCRVHYVDIQQCDYDNFVAHRHPVLLARREKLPARDGPSSAASRSASRDLGAKAPSPRDVDGSAVDPFKTYPSTDEPCIDQFISVYLTAQAFNVYPYYPSTNRDPVLEFFVPLIWKDSVLFHVTLLLGAFHLERNTTRQGTSRFTQLRSRCIELLQKRIDEPFDQSTSDETLSAVAGLATLEHELGNPRLSEAHVSGLRKMLNIRGGIEAIRRSCPVVAHQLFCLFVSVTNGDFPVQDLDQPVTRPVWVYKSIEDETSETCIDIESQGVDPRYAELMRNIRALAKTYRTANDCTTAAEYQDVLDFLCSTLQRLLELPEPHIADKDFDYSASVTVACKHALLSHVFAQWCTSTPDPSLTVRAAQQGLLSALRPILQHRISNELVLWLLCVGGSSAMVPAECKWFVSQLIGVIEDLGITSWAQLRTSLQQVIWHDHQDDPLYTHLWEEVKARDGSLVLSGD